MTDQTQGEVSPLNANDSPSQVIEWEATEVHADLNERVISMKLLPLEEEGRTNAGRLTVQAGALRLPEDAEVLTLNIDHDRSKPVGRGLSIEEKPDGIYARFAVGKTAEGDAALADAVSPTGKRRKVSAEYQADVIRSGRVLAGHLYGAALVERGAYPSAQVLASDVGDLPEDRLAELERQLAEARAELAALTPQTTEADAPEQDPQPTPAEETNTEETAMSDTNEAGATVPALLLPGAAPAAQVAAREADPKQVFAAIANSMFGNEIEKAEATQVLAALTDLKLNTPNFAGNVIQQNWVGQVYQGLSYERTYAATVTKGTNISAGGKKGFRIDRGAAGSPVDHFNGDWAGNLVELPTGTARTSTVTSSLYKFAFANSLGREFFDLPGGAETIEAYVRLILEDYKVWSDQKILATIEAAAGAPIAPSASIPTEYSQAMGMLIQGKRLIEKTKGVPAYALANAAAVEEILYTPKDLVPEFVSFNIVTEGSGLVDGKVNIIEVDGGFQATDNTKPAIIVGETKAIEVDELGETPVKFDALELQRGGITQAFHGYLQTFVPRAEGIVLLGSPE